MSGDHLLDGLNSEQARAVSAGGGPIVVLAGAGSGKTRVLTRRIAYRVLEGETDPRRVLALTFTRKAAGELRTRLRDLGLRENPVAGTFHGVALTQLRERWAERGIEPPTILDRKYRMVAQLVGRSDKVEPMDVVSEIEWARARMIEPADYASAAQIAGRTPPMPAQRFAELLHRYQQEKRQRRVVDFDDILSLALRDLLADPDYAAAVRWRHRHLYVDEFQDVNPLQAELLSAWRGRRDDLFVVGDPNQAIYGWNGADPELLDAFARREPTATVIRLDRNYRSTPQVLTVAGAALAGRSGQLQANLPDGPLPTLTAYPNEEAEARGIAEAIRASHSIGGSWSSQAVLVRTNAQLVPIEQALVASGIPVRVRGGAGPLSSREVKDKLRELGRPGINLVAAVADLDQALGFDSSTDSGDDDDPDDIDTSSGVDDTTLAPVIDLRGRTRVEAQPVELSRAELDRRANLGALSGLIHDYLSLDPHPSGPGLVAWVGTIQAGEVSTDRDAVELATFHAAKGLEWPVVHLAGLENGFVPISYAKTGAQLAEERRLLYVAITRAEKQLHISHADERTFGTKARRRQPSPYLVHLAEAIEHLRRGHRPVDWRAKVIDSRHQLQSDRPNLLDKKVDRNPQHDPVFDALKAWRRDRSRAADVPAYVICNDQTLRTLAKQCPTSRSQLAKVNGLGPARVERFGQEILDIIASSSIQA